MTDIPAALDRLAEVLPPPADPVEVPTVADWTRCEERLDTRLPADFKSYLERYGTGCVWGFFFVYSPATANENLRLAEQHEAMVAGHAEVEANQTPGDPTWDRDHHQSVWRRNMMWPSEDGGFLACGTSENFGDIFGWDASRSVDPDLWTMACGNLRDDTLFASDLTFLDWLFAAVTDALPASPFPPLRDAPDDADPDWTPPPAFVPLRPGKRRR